MCGRGSEVAAGSAVEPTRSPAHVQPVHLQLLGGWSMSGPPGSDRMPVAARRLLAYLALRGPASRPELAVALWPEADESRACGNLRTALWRLRSLHPDLLTGDSDRAALGPSVRVDVEALLRALRLVEAGRLDDELRALPAYLLDGELLPGWDDEWLLPERERFRQLRLHALEGLAAALAHEGRFGLAVEAALAAVRQDPLRESAHRALVLVHLREGNRSEAVRHYRACCRLLADELGVEPSPALHDLLAAHPAPGAVPAPRQGPPVRLTGGVPRSGGD